MRTQLFDWFLGDECLDFTNTVNTTLDDCVKSLYLLVNEFKMRPFT